MPVCSITGRRPAPAQNNKMLPFSSMASPHNDRGSRSRNQQHATVGASVKVYKICAGKGRALGMNKVTYCMTPDIMLKLKKIWFPGKTFNSTMLWVAVSLCFFDFLRSGEVTVPSRETFDRGTHLGAEDITVNSQEKQISDTEGQNQGVQNRPFSKGSRYLCWNYRN